MGSRGLFPACPSVLRDPQGRHGSVSEREIYILLLALVSDSGGGLAAIMTIDPFDRGLACIHFGVTIDFVTHGERPGAGGRDRRDATTGSRRRTTSAAMREFW